MNLARPTNSLRWPLLAAAAAFAAIALPATAGATDYCVAPNTTCGGTNVSTFDEALDLADDANDSDRIFLGDATYTAATAGGYAYDQPSGPVEIIGDGAANTRLTTPGGGLSHVLKLFGGPGSSVHDLAIHLPQNVSSGSFGLRTTGSASHLVVDEEPGQSQSREGVELQDGAVLEDSSMEMGPDNSAGVVVDDSGGTVRTSTLSGGTGVSSNGPALIERSRINAVEQGILTGHNTTEVKTTLIRISGMYGTAISTNAQQLTVSTVHADGVTMIGPGTDLSAGVIASTIVFPSESTSIQVTNSVIRDFGAAFKVGAKGSGTASVQASYSDYDPSQDQVIGANASFTTDHVTNAGDPRFANPAAGDFHLLPGSPLIDAGDPATAAGFDLDGNTLLFDGDSDGVARRDMGAFELQATLPGTPPPAPATQHADAQPPVISGFKRHGRSFSFKLSEPARVTLTIGRAKKGRSSKVVSLRKSAMTGANTIRLSRKRALRAGRYSATLVAVDAAGNRSKPLRIKFRVR